MKPPASRTHFDYSHTAGRLIGVAAVGGGASLAVLVGAFTDVRQFAFSYLFAYLFFFTISLGSFFWVLVHYAVDARWSVVVRRQMEHLAGLMAALAVLFLPFVFVAPHLWGWMALQVSNEPLLAQKQPFLSPWFFWLRTAVFLAFFAFVPAWMRTNSTRQDDDGSPQRWMLNRRISFACLPGFAVFTTFTSIDWLMGLDYRWASSLFGVYFFAGSALAAICALVLVVEALRGAGYLAGLVTPEHDQILGKLMLAFTLFWAYIVFSQYMLVWYANIPAETSYFLRRSTGSWQALCLVLVAGHFFVPFLLLLSRAGKRRPGFLCGVAGWILLMHALDIYIAVLPSLHKAGAAFHWMDAACLLAIGCTLAAVFVKRLGDSPLWPLRDPRIEESVSLKN